MKQLFAVLLCVGVVSLLPLGAVTAAENSSVDVDGTDGCESIDSIVYVCEADYDSGSDEATLEFYSTQTESIELLDAGAALGGERTEHEEL